MSWDDVVVDKPYSREGENPPCLHRNPKPSWKKCEQQALTHLYVVPSYSQVPPMACRLSRKKMKYRQRMARHAEVGDQLLLSLEDSPESLEELFGGPLAQFIKLSAADSGLDPSQTQDLLVKLMHPLFLKAKAEVSKADNPNWKQAMSGPFTEEFWKAAVKECCTLEGIDAWEIVDQPLCAKILDIIWAFKIKQFPDGLIKGFKGRICARGDQQEEGDDFFETYAPVVQWTTICLMLILEVLLELKSKQGDVTAAFLMHCLDQTSISTVRCY